MLDVMFYIKKNSCYITVMLAVTHENLLLRSVHVC